MTATVSLTICQYCEHANRVDAKFCSGCGAPLHLVPCPTCGAVNQKTSKTCYQCHGQLHESTEILLAHEPVAAQKETTKLETVAAPYPYVSAPPRQHPSIVVVGIILAAFAAAAYFAYQQRGVVGAASNNVKVSEPLPASAGAINKAQPVPAAPKMPEPAVAVAGVPIKQDKADDVVTTPVAAASPTPDVGRASSGRRRASVEPPAEAGAAAKTNAASGIQRQPPKIGPCTEAVAALGLCTPGPTKGKE